MFYSLTLFFLLHDQLLMSTRPATLLGEHLQLVESLPRVIFFGDTNSSIHTSLTFNPKKGVLADFLLYSSQIQIFNNRPIFLETARIGTPVSSDLHFMSPRPCISAVYFLRDFPENYVSQQTHPLQDHSCSPSTTASINLLPYKVEKTNIQELIRKSKFSQGTEIDGNMLVAGRRTKPTAGIY